MFEESSFTYDRRRFLTNAGLGLAAVAVTSSPDALAAARPSTRDLAELLAGNARFIAGKPAPAQSVAQREKLASGQAPFAAVLGCADSRVPVETVFDQPPGEIFTVRVAGNTADDPSLGSLEFAVAVLKSSLVLVLGHASCGAVGAAVKYVKDGATVPGHMMAFVKPIVPAAKAAKDMHGDWTANAVKENVRETVRSLTERSMILREAAVDGSVSIVGAVYDLHSGKVTVVT